VSDLRKLAAQAMEYLAAWSVGESPNASEVNDLIADLDAALAQPEPTRSQQMRDAGYTRRPRQLPKEDEPEPFGWLYESKAGNRIFHLVSDDKRAFHADMEAAEEYPDGHKMTPLYTHPPQRKPLTQRQIFEDLGLGSVDVQFVRMVERAHGIGDLWNLFEADKADSKGGEV
jgi:hypothetical protein